MRHELINTSNSTGWISPIVLGTPFMPIKLIRLKYRIPYKYVAFETSNSEYKPEYLKIVLYKPKKEKIGKAISMEYAKAFKPLSDNETISPRRK